MELEAELRDRGRWPSGWCSMAKLLDLLGTKTAFPVVRECLHGTARFDDFIDRPTPQPCIIAGTQATGGSTDPQSCAISGTRKTSS